MTITLFSPSIYLSIYLSIYPSIDPSIYLSIYLSIYSYYILSVSNEENFGNHVLTCLCQLTYLAKMRWSYSFLVYRIKCPRCLLLIVRSIVVGKFKYVKTYILLFYYRVSSEDKFTSSFISSYLFFTKFSSHWKQTGSVACIAMFLYHWQYALILNFFFVACRLFLLAFSLPS